MGSFTLTNKAKADLKSIAIYTQRKWGRPQRVLYLKQYDDAFHQLADAPDMGVMCDFIKQGYRKFPITSHVIYYRIVDDTQIEIIRILHKRMDVQMSFNP